MTNPASQQPAPIPIPEELRHLHVLAKNHEAWIRSRHDEVVDGARISMWSLTELIECIARLKAALREVEAHHVEINRRANRYESFSQTLRIVRAALSTPLGTPGRDKP